MNAFVETITNENTSCCPKLSITTRITGFIITFLLGICITIGSLPSLFGAVVGGTTFAWMYTLGNIVSLCSYILYFNSIDHFS